MCVCCWLLFIMYGESRMKKRYLKTVEDVIALKDTDTKILIDDCDEYYKFVGGIFCRFRKTGDFLINASILIDGESYYILEEEPIQEAIEEDINKLCWFWGSNNKNMELGILESVNCDEDEIEYASSDGFCYHHCRRLSPAEVAEITGYKVEEK